MAVDRLSGGLTQAQGAKRSERLLIQVETNER